MPCGAPVGFSFLTFSLVWLMQGTLVTMLFSHLWLIHGKPAKAADSKFLLTEIADMLHFLFKVHGRILLPQIGQVNH